MAKIQWRGLKQLKGYFETAPQKMQSEIVKTVKHCGAMCHQEETRNVAVDTGFLKRSIIIGIEDAGLTARIEPTAEYAGYVEYGTRYMSAQPFVRPAYKKATDEFKKMVKKIEK